MDIAFINIVISLFFVLSALVFGLFAGHRTLLAIRFNTERRNRLALPLKRAGAGPLPTVTVQLPIYNERFVVERLVRAAAAIDYPRELLEIQVLDDSTDETSEQVAALVEELQEHGVRISQIRRRERTGFKAGALAHGLESATGEMIAVFDADFIPPGDFLVRAVPHFSDPGVGMVQGRWTFINEADSFITRAQALSLRAHFRIEHFTRFLSGCFFNFNGTAGIWRREAIESAGGWQSDTLTEDLDLSYRAQLAGWKFVYDGEIECPSELPPTIKAYKTQQHRWMKGMAQTARKILPGLVTSDLPLRIKMEAVFHLMAPVTYPVTLFSFILIAPLLLFGTVGIPGALFYASALLIATGCLFYFHASAERETDSWAGTFDFGVRFLGLLILGAGNSLNGTRAVTEGILGISSPFVRTPKYGEGNQRLNFCYKTRAEWIVAAEGVLSVYAFASLIYVSVFHSLLLPWALLFFLGTFFFFAAQIRETFEGAA